MDDVRVDFLFNLYFIGRMLKGHYKDENKDLMLTVAILHLLQKRGYTLSELAKVMYSKLSSLSEKIASMEGEGLIKKISAPEDEREQMITLTTKGRHSVEKSIESMGKHCVEFTQGVTKDELKNMNPILKKMIS